MKGGRRLYDAFLAPGGAVLALLFLVPLAYVVVASVGTVDILNRPQLGFDLQNYQQVFQPYYVPVLLRTLAFAAITTVACLLIGYPVAYTAARFAGRRGPLLIALVVLPWLVDYLVRIYAWQAILTDDGLLNGLLGHLGLGSVHLFHTNAAVVIGLIYGYLPLMVLPLYSALTQLDASHIDAGKDLYGTPRQTFFHVTLPATLPGVVGGTLLVFLPSLGDFATAQFLGSPQSTMIGNLITAQFRESGSQTFGAALTVTLIALLVVGVSLAALLARRGTRRAARGGVL